MSRLNGLIREIHRRSLWQVLGIYLVGSWVALQVVEQLAEAAGFPTWVRPFALALLVLGFPIVMATAFVQEGVGGARQGPSVSTREDEPARPSQPAPAILRRPHHRLFTWRNALLGGVAGFALLGAATAGYTIMRTLGIGPAGTLVAKGVLEERDRILIADFGNRTADPLLARTATEALRIDLSQSEVIRLAEPAFVSAALQRMQRSAEEGLDTELARELARREGIKAVLGGEIGQLGESYVLTAQLVLPETGEILVSTRETADSQDAIINAVDRTSKRLRERIGESLRSVQAAPPLASVTTADFEALRMYSQAVRAIDEQGEIDRGLALLDEAVSRDSAFAMAWRKLGIQLSNLGRERARSVEALTQAFRHRGRLSERERLLATAGYYDIVTGELDRAITAYENLLEVHPEDGWALNNIAVAYRELREFARGEEYATRALAADSMVRFPLDNLIDARFHQGKVEGADEALAILVRRFSGNPQVHLWLAARASALGEYDSARAEIEAMRRETAGNLSWRAETSFELAAIAQTRGRLAEGTEHLRDAMAADESRGLPEEYVARAAVLALVEAVVRRNPSVAAEALDEAVARHPLSTMDPLDRPYVELIEAYAWAGRPAQARVLLEERDREVDKALVRRPAQSHVVRARAALALSEDRFQEAIEGFRASEFGGCLLCPLPGLALAYERAGDADSAISVHARYVQTSALFRVFSDRVSLGPTLERLGQLYDAAGDLEKAAEYYAKFVELWAEADAELQPRVQAAQARLEEIVRVRG